jgi:hypothetical protein
MILEKRLTSDQKAELLASLEQISTYYGVELQELQLMQEMAEFIQAHTKAWLACRLNQTEKMDAAVDHQVEEFADVAVVWLQVFMLMHPDYQKLVVDTMLAKTRRQIKRIEEGKA